MAKSFQVLIEKARWNRPSSFNLYSSPSTFRSSTYSNTSIIYSTDVRFRLKTSSSHVMPLRCNLRLCDNLLAYTVLFPSDMSLSSSTITKAQFPLLFLQEGLYFTP